MCKTLIHNRDHLKEIETTLKKMTKLSRD